MRPLFYPYIHPKPRGERLFEADAYAEADDGGEGAVRYCGGYEDGDGC